MMESLMVTITWWHWIGVGAFLLIIEVLTGTGVLLWVGMASLFLALLLLLLPMSLGLQLLALGALSILSAIVWRTYLHYYPTKTTEPQLNKRAEQYIGRTFTLKTSVVNGRGILHVDDTMWRVSAMEDISSGTQIRVVGADGVMLLIEKMK